MLLAVNICFSQDSIQAKKIYSLQDLEKEINLKRDWKSKIGNNLSWKDTDFNEEEWKPQTAVFFNPKDPAYKGEMWFRQKIQIDSSLVNVPLSLIFNSKADATVYIDGEYKGIFGKAEMISNPDNEKNKPVVLRSKMQTSIFLQFITKIHFILIMNRSLMATVLNYLW